MTFLFLSGHIALPRISSKVLGKEWQEWILLCFFQRSDFNYLILSVLSNSLILGLHFRVSFTKCVYSLLQVCFLNLGQENNC